MPRFAFGLSLALNLAFLTATSTAQITNSDGTPVPILDAERKQFSRALTQAGSMPMPLVAPLFIEDRDFTSSLVLVNGSDVHTYADVVLRALDGGQITRRRVQLHPYGQSRVDVGSILRSAGSSASTGSIIVTQSPDLQGMAVAAQLSMNFVKYPQPSYIDEEVAMPSPHGSTWLVLRQYPFYRRLSGTLTRRLDFMLFVLYRILPMSPTGVGPVSPTSESTSRNI